jgi:hypothetical protein
MFEFRKIWTTAMDRTTYPKLLVGLDEKVELRRAVWWWFLSSIVVDA